MSIQVQQFTPHSKYNVYNQKLDLGIDLQDKKIQKIIDRLSKKVLGPILKKDYKKAQPLSDKKIREFIKISIALADALQQKYNLDQLGQSDIEAYQNSMGRIKNSSWISNESRENALKTIDILMDYSRIILPIAINNPSLLENAGKQIDLKDLFRSLYGSLLAYVCLLVILDVEEFQNDQRFSIITNHGYNFAKNLDGYIDTIDILTKPDEDARLRKIK
jgi:hypothetical protein